jgi:hypothetical protein
MESSDSLAGQVLTDCATRAAAAGPELSALAAKIRDARNQLGEPVRLAVTGQIKRGKSTLVNSLLRADVAATGQLELTFTVTEFRYGDPPVVVAHYRGGTNSGPLPPEALDRLTVRDPAMLSELRRIRKVEYALPNELLRSFRLVDTPGLGSVHVTDAENTMDYLGISAAFANPAERAAISGALDALGRTGAEIHQDSSDESATADALLYLFTAGVHERDLAAVAAFLGPAGARVTPLRAFAVMSRCDDLWPPEPGAHSLELLAAPSRITARYMRNPEVRRYFYTIVPVAAKVAIGARLLAAEHIEWLDTLAAATTKDTAEASDSRLIRVLSDRAEFATMDEIPGVPLPAGSRAELLELLGGWGIFLAARARRDGSTADQVRDLLENASGIPRLRDLVISHFGNRAAGIKLDRAIQEVTSAVDDARLRHQLAGRQVPDAVGDIADQLERLRNEDHDAAEFAVLADYYNDKLTLSDDEAAELLALSGEHGTSSAARLGLPATATPRQLRQVAERLASIWAQRDMDPTLDPAMSRAARRLRGGYDRIRDQVSEEP